jgi:hypothetical protein
VNIAASAVKFGTYHLCRSLPPVLRWVLLKYRHGIGWHLRRISAQNLRPLVIYDKDHFSVRGDIEIDQGVSG